MILFTLSSAIGNCLFTLPALKELARTDTLDLYIDDDYRTIDLWKRNRYAHCVYHPNDTIPSVDKYSRYITAHCPPVSLRTRVPMVRFESCGWPHGTAQYPWPEWKQVKLRACGNSSWEDVSDWIKLEREASVDFGLVPCGKPTEEWSRKKWHGFHDLAKTLLLKGHSVEAFGLPDEIAQAQLIPLWYGSRPIESLPEALTRCRVIIANDCGIGHLASSLGIPTVMLFMATSPVKGEPLGRHHRIIATGCERAPSGCQSTPVWRECENWICQRITVEQVLDCALPLLSVLDKA